MSVEQISKKLEEVMIAFVYLVCFIISFAVTFYTSLAFGPENMLIVTAKAVGIGYFLCGIATVIVWLNSNSANEK